MWRNLFLLALLSSHFSITNGGFAAVNVTKFFTYATPDKVHQIFYTGLTKDAVLANYNAADYPIQKNFHLGVFAELAPNNSCPELYAFHSVTTADGVLKYERADMMTPDLVDHGLAGYLAPFIGYCHNLIPIIELYSETMNEYCYDQNLQNTIYQSNWYKQFRPTRWLGYSNPGYPTTFMAGDPPFILTGYTDPQHDYMMIRFDMVAQLKKGGKMSYVATPELVKQLIEQEGWTLDQYYYGVVSVNNDIKKIRQQCGGSGFLQRCRDTYNPATGFYRPINIDRMPIDNLIVVGNCGYYMTTTACFQNPVQTYSADLSVGVVHNIGYGTQASWTSPANSVGYSSRNTFEMKNWEPTN